MELANPSYLIRGDNEPCPADIKFLVTAAFDSPEFKIWKMQLRGPYNRPEFNFHIKIETSLSGIAQVLQSSPEQIVCVDTHKTLKFYDFVDRAEQQKEAEFQQRVTEFADSLKALFQQIDKDNSGNLDLVEAAPLADKLIDVRCAR